MGTNLKTIEFPESLTYINGANAGADYDGPFKNCPLEIENLDLKNIQTINGYAFANCRIGGTLDLTRVTFLGRNAFSGNNITKVVFNPNGQFSMAGSVFQGNPIKKLIIPEGFNSNSSDQLSGVSNCYLEYPESYTARIHFANGTNSVLHIKRKIDTTEWTLECISNYNGTQPLKYLYLQAIEPPLCSGEIFRRSKSPDKIFVPVGSLQAYTKATNWSRYSTLFEEFDYENSEVPQTI